MINTNSVNEQIQIGRHELGSSPKAILSLRRRTRIWAAMNDPDDIEISFKHRVKLKLMCIHHVKHIWRSILQEEAELDEMISLVYNLVSGNTPKDEGETAGEKFLQKITDRYGNEKSNFPAIMIADAVSDTVASACYMDPDLDIVDTADDDDGMLPDMLEASYTCASAVAGALNWQPLEETDVAARRAFWLWYLDEAIPTVLAG